MSQAQQIDSAPCGWTLWTQDFRGRIPGVGQKPPEKIGQQFPTKAAAEAEMRRLPRHPEIVRCVTPTPSPKAKGRGR